MKRIVWLTDIHLNHLSLEHAEAFAESLRVHRSDAFVIAGDIGESHSTVEYLLLLDKYLQRPLYFVLGNHDYYRGSIESLRAEISAFSRKHERITWLPDNGPIELTPTVGLLGVEGWADGGYGNYLDSPVLMADYFMIRELMSIFPDGSENTGSLHIYSPEHEEWLYTPEARRKRHPVISNLARDASRTLYERLPQALSQFEQVILVTHVPPFTEACRHDGRQLNGDWLPHYASRAVGDTIREIMTAHPDRRLTILCGHTHCAARAHIGDNIEVITGAATYGRPEIQDPIEIF